MNRSILVAMASIAGGMEILDASVVNVTLAHMRGGLSAGIDEVAWVLTAYLVANAVILPLTGWLAAFFGRKRFFIFCTALFGACSALAGVAPNLPVMVVFRILQGLGGGALSATGQAIVMEMFPPDRRGMAMALWGAGSIAGSISGPIIGGQIADHFDWRWVFYLNVPLATLVVLLAALFLEDPPYLVRPAAGIDTWGFVYLVLWVGCLQIVLGRGQRLDWFNSTWITTLTIVAAVAFVFFAGRELTADAPAVDVWVLMNRTFAVGILLTAVQSFAFYGAILLIALFAQTLMGYSTLQAGLVIASGASSSVLTMPLAGRLMNVVDARLIIGGGALLAGWAMVEAASLTAGASFWQVLLPRFLLGAGLGWMWVPLNAISLGAVPKERMGNAAGLLNLMRNLGGSLGIAVLTTLLSRGAQAHQARLVANVTPWDPDVRRRLDSMAAALGPAGGNAYTRERQALGLLYGEVQRQALLLSFLDAFWLIAWLLFLVVPLLLTMRSTRVARGER